MHRQKCHVSFHFVPKTTTNKSLFFDGSLVAIKACHKYLIFLRQGSRPKEGGSLRGKMGGGDQPKTRQCFSRICCPVQTAKPDSIVLDPFHIEEADWGGGQPLRPGPALRRGPLRQAAPGAGRADPQGAGGVPAPPPPRQPGARCAARASSAVRPHSPCEWWRRGACVLGPPNSVLRNRENPFNLLSTHLQ